jgi:hypothetical protein
MSKKPPRQIKIDKDARTFEAVPGEVTSGLRARKQAELGEAFMKRNRDVFAALAK